MLLTSYSFGTSILPGSNTYKTLSQQLPDSLGLSNGGFVGAYNNPDGAIRLDFYGANLAPIGAARFPADNGVTSKAVGQPSLTQLANGNVLVVWDEDAPGSPGLRGHLYTATGTPIGTELTFGTADFAFSDPQVAALKNGDFVISYNYGSTVVYSVFDASGTYKTGAAINPNAGMNDTAVAALADGGFVVTYTEATNPNNP